MDIIDKQILALLSANARIAVKEIAEQVSLTSPAVSGRIRRLEREGVIAGYTLVVHPTDAKTRVNALISISVQPADREGFLQALKGLSPVQECYHVTGSYSYIAKVSCRDMDELEHLINKFHKYGQTSTQIILSALPGAHPAVQ